ncbi:hypothetical protein GCM10020254_29890 [Streptomyces goshikiensis]
MREDEPIFTTIRWAPATSWRPVMRRRVRCRGGGGRPGRPRVRGENDGLRQGEVLRDSGENGTDGADGSTGDRPSIDASGLPGFFPNGPGTDRERFGIGLI